MLVSDICMRAMTLLQLLEFFIENIGIITFVDDDPLRPECMPTKLMQKCKEINLQHRHATASGVVSTKSQSGVRPDQMPSVRLVSTH